MSLAQLSQTFKAVAEFQQLKDADDGISQLNGQAKSIAQSLLLSEAFVANASPEEVALVQKYVQEQA